MISIVIISSYIVNTKQSHDLRSAHITILTVISWNSIFSQYFTKAKTWLPDSKNMGLVPEWTTGRKVKGTETCGHTVMEPGNSLMTGSTLTHRRDNSTDTRTL